jgi:long-chain acyl-CoA synthetase
VLKSYADSCPPVAGFDVVIGRHLSPEDFYLAYLPLAHVLEFAFEHSCLFWGTCIGYGSPKTLFNSSTVGCHGDLRELRPTLMLGVPAVWESIRKAIFQATQNQGLISMTLFWSSLYVKRALIAAGLGLPAILESAAFDGAREFVGGRLRFMLTGGGPISEETQEFLSFAIAPLINGFGLTETMA